MCMILAYECVRLDIKCEGCTALAGMKTDPMETFDKETFAE